MLSEGIMVATVIETDDIRQWHSVYTLSDSQNRRPYPAISHPHYALPKDDCRAAASHKHSPSDFSQRR